MVPQAAALAKEVLAEEPTSVAALEVLSDVQAEIGSPELTATVEKLMALAPGNAKGLHHGATILLYRQRVDEAMQMVRKSIAADSSNARARNLLAIAYGLTFSMNSRMPRSGKRFRICPTTG